MDWSVLVKRHLNEETNRHTFVHPPKRYQAALDERPNPLSAGHATMDAIRDKLVSLDSSFMQRTFDQARGQDLFLSCLCRRVYGEAFEANQEEIMEYNNWDDLGTDAAIETPRRFGKTVLLSIILAAIAYYVPGTKIAIFACSLRQTDKNDGVLSWIKKVLVEMGVVKFTKDSQNHLFFQVDGDAREIRAFPSVESFLEVFIQLTRSCRGGYVGTFEAPTNDLFSGKTRSFFFRIFSSTTGGFNSLRLPFTNDLCHDW